MRTTDLRVLAESAHFLLSHAAESVYVVDKRDGSTRIAGQHVGGPGVGLITADEQWFCSGGEGVQCLSQAGVVLSFFRGRASADASAQTAVWFVHGMSAVNEFGSVDDSCPEASMSRPKRRCPNKSGSTFVFRSK